MFSPEITGFTKIWGRFLLLPRFCPTGELIVLADALSRIYSNEPKGTERAKSEYVHKEASDPEDSDLDITRPLLGGRAAQIVTNQEVMALEIRRNPTRDRQAPKRYDPEIPGIVKIRKNKEKKTRNESSTLDVELEGGRVPPNQVVANANDPAEPEHLAKLVTEVDVIESIRNKYDQDDFFGKIVDQLDQFPNYKLESGLLFMHEHQQSYLCVPQVSIGEYDVRTLLISHAHSLVSHLGNKKTYAYMRESLWWKTLAKDVATFCASCILCASSRTPTQNPYGLLKPLPVPLYPWSQIGVDFVGPLPESSTLLGNFDMICVIIDHLTLMVHLVPTRQDYTAKNVAEVMYNNVYKLHGLPVTTK